MYHTLCNKLGIATHYIIKIIQIMKIDASFMKSLNIYVWSEVRVYKYLKL